MFGDKMKYYSKCFECQYYKYNYDELFALMNERKLNSDMFSYVFTVYREYREHIKTHFSSGLK